jgi:FkbM family methyltransferase
MTPLPPFEEDIPAMAHARFDLAIHIGAGADAETSPELADRFVLVEPDPEAASMLRDRMAGMAAVEIVETALTGADGTGTLHVFNVPGCASLRRATELRTLFPGLETIRTTSVKTVSPATFLAALDCADQDRILLIVDTPGEELPVLEGLLAAHNPRAFAEIRFRCGELALYEGAEDADRVSEALREAGFIVEVSAPIDDPDRPLHVATPDHAAALSKAKALLAERDAALKAAQDAQAEREAELAGARETLAARNQALETAQSDLSLGLRLQSLREADLKALQARYGKLLNENEEQAKLLRQLTERLSAAAYYLEQIEGGEHWLGDIGTPAADGTPREIAGDA